MPEPTSTSKPDYAPGGAPSGPAPGDDPRMPPGAETGTGPGAVPPPGPPSPDPLDELKAAAGNLGEVVAYAQQYINAKISGTLYTVRKMVMMAVLAAVAGLAGVSVVVTSAVLLVIGLSQALAAPLPLGWKWVGAVVVGGVGVLISVAGAWLIVRWAAAAGREAAAQHYRETLLRQRQAFGTDAMSRAAERESETGTDTRAHRQDGKDPGVTGDEETLNH